MTNLPSIVAGDDRTYSINITDRNDEPRDISGWTIRVTLKERKTDTDSDAVIKKDVTSHTAPTEGQTEFSFTSTETKGLDGTYFYDIQITDSNGDVYTATIGSVKFYQGVTDRE